MPYVNNPRKKNIMYLCFLLDLMNDFFFSNNYATFNYPARCLYLSFHLILKTTMVSEVTIVYTHFTKEETACGLLTQLK